VQLQSEGPSYKRKTARLHTVAASSNTGHAPWSQNLW